jgi:hypothetical protein
MQRGCSYTRLELLNIGFIVSSPVGLPGCGKVIGRGARAACLLQIYGSCGMISGALPGNWDMAKTSGMVSYYRTIWRSGTPLRSAYGNPRGCSTNLDSVSRDPVANLAKQTLKCKTPLKKLLQMDERPHNPALVRGRSPFPAAQQFDTNVGAQGKAAPCALAFVPRQSGILWSARPQNRETADQRSSYFQCRYLWRLHMLSSSFYSKENLPCSGQCEMAQSTSFERAILRKPKPYRPRLFTTLFSRTQSSGTSLENHSQTGYPQPLLPIEPGVGNISVKYFFKMGATKHYT